MKIMEGEIKMFNYSWVTNEMFDKKLKEIINFDLKNTNDPASVILSISGIYEILSEEYNNAVLEALNNERQTD